MFYLVPTKNGIGVQIWGTYDDLNTLYDIVGKFWNQEEYLNKSGFDNRDKLISILSYELRKAYSGSRLTRKTSHFSFEKIKYFGCHISWPHLLFSLSAIRFNMSFLETDKLEIATFLQLEYWLEKSMLDYDQEGGQSLKPFIFGAIYGGNECIYQYMRNANAIFLRLGGGKRAFRTLYSILQIAVYHTDEYLNFSDLLKQDADRLNCKTSELEINDDDIDYEKLKW